MNIMFQWVSNDLLNDVQSGTKQTDSASQDLQRNRYGALTWLKLIKVINTETVAFEKHTCTVTLVCNPTQFMTTIVTNNFLIFHEYEAMR